MTIREKIHSIIQKSLRALQKSGALGNKELPEVKIEYPADSKLGDYASNIAFLISKSEKQKPFLIAQMIAEKIIADKSAQEIFEKVEAAGAGFINFKLSVEFLSRYARSRVARQNVGKGQKLNIEFLSANPTGQFQVGNGRGAFYGDVLGNIFKLAGYKVTKEYYINNAKSSNQIIELGKTALGMGEKYLTPYVEEKIEELQEELASLIASPAQAGFLLAQAVHKDNKNFLEKIGIHYDVWTREQEDLVDGGLIKKTFELLKKKGLVYDQDGAQWLKTTQSGDDKDKVLMRSSGEHGYFLADIAYHLHKIERGYKMIIDIFGADHQGHVLPMKIAMPILGYKGKFDILVSQLVQAKGGGKFSKRAGNVIPLEELIDEVGLDVARYFYLMKSLDTQMEFDMDLAKEQSEKNPVYYIQYAHARMASILRKPKATSQKPKLQLKSQKLLSHPSELALIKILLRWSEVIEDTVNDYQVQRVTSYAYELASIFNQFYRDCKVISSDQDLTKARLELVLAAQEVLKEVLSALGISAPEKM